MGDEFLKIAKNGQWALQSLKKNWGSPIYEQVSHGKSPFKDLKAASEAKSNLLENIKAKPYAKSQKMVNAQTGKEETHVLLHRGLPGDSVNSVDPAGKGPNRLNFSSGTHIETDHNSVHTLHPEEAEGHCTDYGEHAKHVSFWAPLSSIHGSGHFIDKHLGHSEEGDDEHVLVAPGKYPIHQVIDYIDGTPVPS